MAETTLHDIIEFAKNREREAVAFYHELQAEAPFAGVKSMLADLEAMEKGHITVLESIERQGIKDLKPKKVADLKISNYLVAPDKPEDELEYQDILILAMKREEASCNLYNELASRAEGTEAEKVFSRVASEEAGHKLKFEALYDEHILKEN